jgi:hypothetical protein
MAVLGVGAGGGVLLPEFGVVPMRKFLLSEMAIDEF